MAGFDGNGRACDHDVKLARFAEDGMPYVGVGGSLEKARGEVINLGYGIRRPGARAGSHWGRWFFFFAMGYVNGIPVPAILYFIATRRMGARIWHRTFWRERVAEQNGLEMPPYCSPFCKWCEVTQ